MTNTPKPIALIILDGWGYREEHAHNPTQQVATPTFDHLYQNCPYTLIEASGAAVGLPDGQIGNSEVGHLHIGSGRKVPQDLTRIRQAIQNGEFFQNTVLQKAIQAAKANDRAVHIFGLVSPGGVHSHENQIMALMDLIAQQGVSKSYLHAFLDGRDVPPKSAMASIEKISARYQALPGGQIASLIGRYYAMDRDLRWERTQAAYDCLTLGKADYHADTATAALEMAYARDETDEFVKPTCVMRDKQAITVQDGDVVIFMNFRADRARQLTRAFIETDFIGFERTAVPALADYVTLTMYNKNFNVDVAYPPMAMHNTLGEYLATKGYQQCRLAETEKYAHVTYFLNGGMETAFPGEDRVLIPSPKVATYDLQPEMSAYELTDKIIEAINGGQYDAIMCNYANPDMVGHTGIEAAAAEAVSVVDACIKRVLDALAKVGGEALITADHGNIEDMYNNNTGQPHTAHTTNLVPLIYVGRTAKFVDTAGALDDVAPTFLYAMGLDAPSEMTGKNLLRFK